MIKERFGRLYHFPRHWADCGHRVTVVAADYKSMKSTHLQEPNLHIVAAPFFKPWAGFGAKIRESVKANPPDIVIASCDSHFGYIGMRLAQKLNVPFVFDLYHNYEDFGSNRVPGMRWMYRKALSNAALVVCDSERLAERIGTYSQNTHIAPQATDNTVFRALDRDDCCEKLGLDKNHRNLVYVGNVDSRFDENTLIRTVELLAESGHQPRLIIAGPGLSDLHSNHPLVHYLGRLPQEKIPLVIGCADLCLIPYRRTLLAETCNPCKLSEYIACGRPIIASNISNIAEYLPRSGYLCYEPENVDSLLASISAQLARPILEEQGTALLWENVGAEYLIELEKLTTLAAR